MAKTCPKTSHGKILPSLPVVVFRLIEATDDESRSLKNLAGLASKDPALSTQILRLANSPLMNAGRPVRSLTQAALNLGVPTIRNLAVTVAVCQSFSHLDVPGSFSISAFWNHSLACAIIAKLLADSSLSPDCSPEEAFLAGLLHDLGQLSLVVKNPSFFDRIVQNPRTGQTILDSERDVWGTDHVEEGYRLLKAWGIHQNILDAVKYHHRDVAEIASSSKMVRLVFFSDLLSHFMAGQSSLELHEFEGMYERLQLGKGSLRPEDLFRRAGAQIRAAGKELGLKIEKEESDALPTLDARDRKDRERLAGKALDFSVLAGTLEALLTVTNHEELERELFASLSMLTDSHTGLFFLWKNQNLLGLAARGTMDDSLATQIHILGLDESIWEEAFKTSTPVHSHIFFKKHKKRIIDEQIEDYVGGDFLVIPVFAWGSRVGVLVLAISWDRWVEIEPGKDFLMLLAREMGHVFKGLRYRQLWEKEHLINEAIIKKSPVGIILADYSGDIMFCNPAGRVLLGMNNLGFEELNIFSKLALSADSRARVVERVSRGKTVDLGRLRLGEGDEAALWTSVRVVPVAISGVDRFLFLVRGVTAEVLLEMERKQRAIWLETELEKKTRELQQAQDRLIKAERLGAASQLARKVVHEVNNPLGIIKNFLRILKIQKETGEIEDGTIDAISSEIDRVARILRELSDFSRSQQEQVPGTTDSVESVIRELELLMKKTLEEKGVSLETDIEKHLPPVGISRDNLKQVLLNLVKNAEEALEGPGRIMIRACRDSDDANYVVLEVADTGPGIAPEVREKIFEPFVSTKGGKNAGLGLSICYGLVQACGGQMSIVEEEGFSTTIRLRLRIKEAGGRKE